MTLKRDTEHAAAATESTVASPDLAFRKSSNAWRLFRGRAERRVWMLPIQAFFVAIVVLLGVIAGKMASNDALLLTSLISSAVVVGTSPLAPQARAERVAVSHCLAMALGLAARHLIDDRALATAAAVGLALLIVLLLDMLHPPALANAGLAVFSTAPAADLGLLLAAGVPLLCLFALIAKQNARWLAQPNQSSFAEL